MIRLLGPESELAVMKLLLKHDKAPLDMLSFRKHISTYYLEPSIADGFILGDTEAGCMLWATVRLDELILQRLVGEWTPELLRATLNICVRLCKERGYKRSIYMILNEGQLDKLKVDAVLASTRLSSTRTLLPARTRLADKAFWWNTVNRVVFTYDLYFYRLEL